MDGDNRLASLNWRVEGMDCAACVAKVEKAVRRLPGVGDAQVNLMAERLTVSPGLGGVAPETVERQVIALGYRPSRLDAAVEPAAHHHGGHHHHDHHDHDHGHDTPWWRGRSATLVLALAVLGGLACVVSAVLPSAAAWVVPLAALIAVAPFVRRAAVLARAGTPFSIETLMCVAVVGAVAIGAAEEAVVVVVLFALGEMLETVAAGQARAGIRALGALIPRVARRETATGIVEMPADQLAIGDIVQIRPGDRVPCDGRILAGTSALDESPVTGESVPVPRGPGELVLAGSVNADAGLLRVAVMRTAADNTVARIVRLVEEAVAARAPTQRFVERFAAWWTPAAMAAAALVMLVPPLLFGGWAVWAYRGLAVLLIACPCALVISVPAAVASGLSAGARRGLLIKGGAALEAIGSARMVAFDKTGTLTAGRPAVTDVVPDAGVDPLELLRLAAAVEQGSSHPLARAILAHAAAAGIDIPVATGARNVPGQAVQADIGGRVVVVGSPRHAAGLGLDPGPAVAGLEADGKTVVVVVVDGRVGGVIALRDALRADAVEGIAALSGMGVAAVMLTGDNARAGQAIAAQLGLAVRAELLPADKLREVTQLKGEGPVVMVGDGINDAPALAAASVGIAMGGGTDVALETADAAVLHDRVTGIGELFALSRRTKATIHQNVALALALKAVILVTTVIGLTGLWPAILSDTGATVLVTLNALRLLKNG